VAVQETWSWLVGVWVEWLVLKVAPGSDSISRQVAALLWQR
jgi:hypothetical protein